MTTLPRPTVAAAPAGQPDGFGREKTAGQPDGARQLPLRLADDLTPFDRELLDAIRACVDPRTGVARSLFDVAVRKRGLVRRYSGRSLRKLADLGYVELEWAGPGWPLEIRPLA